MTTVAHEVDDPVAILRRHASKPCTRGMLADVLSSVYVIVDHLKAENAELKAENAIANSKLAELAARPELKYAGTWRLDAAFGKGSLVTHGGSLWYALSDSAGRRPGTPEGSDLWRLVVKAGQAR